LGVSTAPYLTQNQPAIGVNTSENASDVIKKARIVVISKNPA
jgi:hypothetical protein